MAGLFSSTRIPFSIADLSSDDIARLTQVLSLPSSTGGTLTRKQTGRASSALIDDLPKHLLRPTRYQHQIANFLHKYVSDIPSSTLAPLCSVHSHLNTQLIHSIFTCLSLEVGIRLNTLTTHIYLYPEHEAFIHSLRQVHALWLAPEIYTRTFKEELPRKWHYETSRCEACMLSRVGGDADTVCKLKIALISRFRGHGHKPLLIRWVDGWLEWLNLNEGSTYLQTAERKVRIDEAAKEIRTARKKALKTRRSKRKNDHAKDTKSRQENVRGHHTNNEKDYSAKNERNHSRKTERDHHEKRDKEHHGKSENPFDDDKEIEERKQKQDMDEVPDGLPEPTGSDFENSIIDHYGALLSTCHLPTQADGSKWQFSALRSPEDEGHIHPAFRNRAGSPSRRDSPRPSTRGEYPSRRDSTRPSTRGEYPSRRDSTRPTTRGAETQARDYQAVLSKLEKTEVAERSRARRASNNTRNTYWGDFL